MNKEIDKTIEYEEMSCRCSCTNEQRKAVVVIKALDVGYALVTCEGCINKTLLDLSEMGFIPIVVSTDIYRKIMNWRYN